MRAHQGRAELSAITGQLGGDHTKYRACPARPEYTSHKIRKGPPKLLFGHFTRDEFVLNGAPFGAGSLLFQAALLLSFPTALALFGLTALAAALAVPLFATERPHSAGSPPPGLTPCPPPLRVAIGAGVGAVDGVVLM